MAIEMKKARVKMIKPTYLGISILDISKMILYEFWHDYIKPKYGEGKRLFYTDTDSFVIHIKTEDFLHLTTMKMMQDCSQYVRIKYQVSLKMN